LDARFFSHLDAEFAKVVHAMGLSLQRCYIVNAIKKEEKGKALEFFEKHATRLSQEDEKLQTSADNWRSWFALPFIKNPGTHTLSIDHIVLILNCFTPTQTPTSLAHTIWFRQGRPVWSFFHTAMDRQLHNLTEEFFVINFP
jgi:hypothetical protein